jgi:hypothetical protein
MGLSLAGHASAQSPLRLAADGAWCWFGNPRAVFKDGKLYFGYVRHADGRACLNVFNPTTTTSSLVWASAMSEKDDHDNPALLELTDGRLLATYQKHSSEQCFYYRLSTSAAAELPANWSAETPAANSGARLSYSNPYQLAAATNRIFLFARNLNYNPTLYLSDASGTNWSSPTVFIKTGVGGVRPYAQYCSDGNSRIEVCYTDGHPNEIPCSLYHLYYQAGALRQTDGTFLRNLADAPLRHDSGERGSVIYPFNTNATSDFNAWIPSGRAWCWDMVYHTNGAPITVFSVQSEKVGGTNWYDDRLYYHYARWTGTNWQKRFIAQAGRPLYKGEQHYAGGITIDPRNPDAIYLSSNARNPFDLTTLTNVPLRANARYEIWRGITTDGGLSFAWQPVTTNSAVDNLRPYVPRRNPQPYGLIWFAGTYTSYTKWDTTVLGWFGTNLPAFSVSPNAGSALNLIKPQSSSLPPARISALGEDQKPGNLYSSFGTSVRVSRCL